jgi:phospholipid/cholesterol/gamma-HCH transport system ATP-binding protein
VSVAYGVLTDTGAGAAGVLRDRLERVLAARVEDVGRMSYAHTSVAFVVLGSGSLTLLLDRRPPMVAPSPEPAEIRIELTPDQAERFSRGALFLPGEIMHGAVRTEGPVRRYLEVDPILRALLAGSAGPGADVHETSLLGSSAADVDPDLLAIETRGVHKSFGAHHVLSGADLRVPEGVISVVLGPSGTGKSVLLRHVIGILRPDEGEIVIRGRPLSRMSRSELLMLRTEIGVMFQDGALFSAMTVFENVAFPLRQHTGIPDKDIRELVMNQLAAVGLADAADKLPAALSGGMKKRAGLARALVLEPSIVICDEPDSGLDPVRTALLGELLVEEHRRIGGTMLVITHDIALARNVGEHISVLWQGRILESGMRDDMLVSESDFVRQFLAGDTVGPLGMDA